MPEKDKTKNADTNSASPATAKSASDGRLNVPKGSVLIRYVGPPNEAMNGEVGGVTAGHIYTVDALKAARVLLVKHPVFELVHEDDRTAVEAAAKALQAGK